VKNAARLNMTGPPCKYEKKNEEDGDSRNEVRKVKLKQTTFGTCLFNENA